ncbi:hypothetical protein [Streptomyces bohaiensis]|uniref:hypothetical protein n=1 Tax=Streptomyces bohaiensis TaxID=1431344 RepID=UPI003B76DA73
MLLRLTQRLLLAAVMTLGALLLGAGSAVADPAQQEWVADYGPPDKPPTEWDGGEQIGVTPGGLWCVVDMADGCEAAEAGVLPGTEAPCTSPTDDCTPEEFEEVARAEFDKWYDNQDRSSDGHGQREAYIEQCISDGIAAEGWVSTAECIKAANVAHPPPAEGPLQWATGMFSEWMANAVQELAMMIGAGVLWMLEQFTAAFDAMSTIDLASSGIGSMLGLMTALSALVAVFLLTIQIIAAGAQGSGQRLATAFYGIGRFAFILAVYVGVTHLGLQMADALGDWIVEVSFGSGDQSSAEAMQERFGELFAGLTTGAGLAGAGGAAVTGAGMGAAAAAVIIVVGLIILAAIAALWLEMLTRTAGILILLVAMPVVLAGQMLDGTKDWWPKARGALIALILMKPAIMLVFGIGFGILAEGEGLHMILVGLLIFVLAAFSWPVLARFLVFTSLGESSGSGSGLVSTLGGSSSSFMGGRSPMPSGAGAARNPAEYGKALEAESGRAAGAAAKSAGGAAGKGAAGFLARTGSVVGMGLQMGAIMQSAVESSMANAGAHAGLGSGNPGGRHVFVAPLGGRAGGGAPSEEPGAAAGSGPAAGAPVGDVAEAAPAGAADDAAPVGDVTEAAPAGAADDAAPAGEAATESTPATSGQAPMGGQPPLGEQTPAAAQPDGASAGGSAAAAAPRPRDPRIPAEPAGTNAPSAAAKPASDPAAPPQRQRPVHRPLDPKDSHG